uniref:Uncharacterized protein LOC100180046 n=1 Tax=Phallusia mammillata TaxID=59560 RepID=A0A6F9DGF1_9ASCI|nr:uncharacterized protein LOC100180046 [Phallusia mammillata]
MLSSNSNCDSSFSWKHAVCAAAFAGGAVAVYKFSKDRLKNRLQPKTKGETDNPYESVALLNQYLAFNYGGPSVNCLFDGPKDGFDFPKATADICVKYFNRDASIPSRALDIGCAVGRASFELAREFQEVIGIDYSHGFVKTCDVLKQAGSMEYEAPVEGDLTEKHTAVVPSDIDRTRCHFQTGDACNLPLNLGKFGCVLAANLICRLPSPTDFLLRLGNLVETGGICVITSPYTFMDTFTPKNKWLGGYVDKNGQEVRAIDTMKRVLSPQFDLVDCIDLPFLIRETARKHQWTVAHVSIWKRK